MNYYMLAKMEGKKIEGSSVIDRLVYLKSILEKLRPVEKKMQYQVDKYLR